MTDGGRKVTFFTQALRRALKIGESPTGEKLPINPSIEQVVAFVAVACVTGPPSWLAQRFVWGSAIVGFFLIPALAYRLVGTIQDGGKAPAVSAHNFSHAAMSWMVHLLLRVRRSDRFDGKTRIVRERISNGQP